MPKYTTSTRKAKGGDIHTGLHNVLSQYSEPRYKRRPHLAVGKHYAQDTDEELEDPVVRMRAAAQHFGGSTGGFVVDPTIDTDEHCIHVFLFQHHNRESCKLVRLTQASVGEDISLGQICIDLGFVLLHGGRHWRAEVARQNAIHTDACGSAPV